MPEYWAFSKAKEMPWFIDESDAIACAERMNRFALVEWITDHPDATDEEKRNTIDRAPCYVAGWFDTDAKDLECEFIKLRKFDGNEAIVVIMSKNIATMSGKNIIPAKFNVHMAKDRNTGQWRFNEISGEVLPDKEDYLAFSKFIEGNARKFLNNVIYYS